MNIKNLMKVTCQSQAIIIFDKNGNKIRETYNLELWKIRNTEEGKIFLSSQIDLIEPIEIIFESGNKCYGLKIVLK